MSLKSASARLRAAGVVRQGLLASAVAVGAIAALPGPASASLTAWQFQTAPNLHPTGVQVLTGNRGLAAGDVFLAPFKDFAVNSPQVGQSGALILDNQGNPVWFRPASGTDTVFDFKVQTYQGKPVLTWWQGPIQLPPATPAGVPVAGQGAFYIADQHYRVIAKVTGQAGWTGDFHDLAITPQGTAVFPVVKDVTTDLSAFPNGSATGRYEDNGIQEVNLKTGKLVGTTWDMAAHVSLGDAKVGIPPASVAPNFVWDPFHINSVDVDTSGHILFSARDTWAIYNVDRASGNLTWTLGGKSSTFTLGPNASFSWQHDAHFLPNNEISLFDDSCCNLAVMPLQPVRPARGLVLKLDTTAKTATVAASFTHDPGLTVPSQGSMQTLSNGNVLIGWGQSPLYSEYNHSGKLLYDVQLPPADESYRVRREVWTGKPLTKPSVLVRRTGRKATLFVSWNGATDVTRWKVLAGRGAKHLKVVKIAKRNGFETTIRFTSSAARFEVKALNARGKLLGTSRLARPAHKVMRTRTSTTTITTKTANQTLGKVLATSRGLSLYVFDGDSRNKSTCSGACAKKWKPLLASGKVVAARGSGVNARKLGTIKRSDGKRQVTYYHRPLYTYYRDKTKANLHGQGQMQFGAWWYLVDTKGADAVGFCNPICGGY
jgi:predicted lipoprotein with Yx(FWY)xxD motif